MLPKIFLFLLIGTFKTLNADVSEFFDNNLTIDTPIGTLFPGENAEFVCHAKNFEGTGELIWHWHFSNRSIYSIIDPVTDEYTKLDKELIRKSVITIPNPGSSFGTPIIAYLGCELAITDHLEDHSHKKLVPLDIFNILQDPFLHNRRKVVYPQIALEVYGSRIRQSSTTPSSPDANVADALKSSRHPPHLVTNQTITLSQDAKSIRLTCIIPKQDADLYDWIISSQVENTEDTKSVKDNTNEKTLQILNKMALIYREAVTSGRLPSPSLETCDGNITNSTRFMTPFQNEFTTSETIELILPPIIQQSQKFTYRYTCRPRLTNKTMKSLTPGLAYVEINLQSTPSTSTKAMQERDQDFLELIAILTQILQSSSGEMPPDGSGGSGNGPIVGVGFGSSTIMILMGLTIFYLKRQLNQIQEQVKENEERQKLRKRSRMDEDTEL